MTLQRGLDGILRCWDWLPPRRWTTHLLFFGPAALLCTAVVYVGAVRTHTCGHDVFILLDGAWRILNGQRPHVDFFSPAGPVMYLATAAGLALAGMRVEGLGFGAALFASVAGVWGYRLSLARMRFSPAVLTGLFLVLLACAPVPLGAGPASLSHAMSYNRYGFALLALVLIEVMEEPLGARKRDRANFLSGISTGVACVLMLFLKASYFLVAVVLVLGFAAFRPCSRRRWAGVIAGSFAALLAMLAFLRWNLGAFIADQILIAQVRGQGVDFSRILQLAWRNQGNLLLMLLMGALLAARRPEGEVRRLEQWKWVLAVCAVFVAGILLMSTNAQDDGLPLSVVLVMLMLGSLREVTADEPLPATVRNVRAACVLAGLLLLGASASLDKVSLLEAVREKWQPPPNGAALLPAHLSGLLMYDLTDPQHPLAYSNGSRYVDSVNEGIRLLQTLSGPQETVATLEQLNPFSYALLRKPAHGGFAFLAYGHSFSDEHKPRAEWLFGETDIIMVPKRNFTDTRHYSAILRNYLPYVQRNFTLAAESSNWWMYRRDRHPQFP